MKNLITILEQAILTLPENSDERRLDVYGSARQVATKAFKEFRVPAERRVLFMHSLETAIRVVETSHRQRAKGLSRRFG